MEALRHGIITTYKKGCRCDECRAARAVINRRYRAKNREKYREWERQNYIKNTEKMKEKGRRFYDPAKNLAHAHVFYALKTGKLTKGDCEQAGEDCWGAIHAHHDDYSKPLQVRWLCASHHGLLHAREKKLATA